MENELREQLLSLFDTAVEAAHPAYCLPSALSELPTDGRLLVLGAGKAAAAMVQAAEEHYIATGHSERISGSVVTRYGYKLPTKIIELVEASHPVPDEAGARAAERSLELAEHAGPQDLILVLLSGGASALWTLPAQGIGFEDKQDLNRQLLASGARISEINCVRKHLSRIKGGRLAKAAGQARLLTLAISDVPGDNPGAIGSGPTVGDATTLADARAVVDQYQLTLTPAIEAALQNPANETPFPGDPAFARSHYELIARPGLSLAAAAKKAKNFGYQTQILGDSLEGEARELAKTHAELALAAKQRGEKIALLSGGEVTVTLTGEGRGGPNQEYGLALAISLDSAEGIRALVADTDGADGGEGAPDDPAGALIDPSTLARARGRNLNPATFLANNDSGGFFAALDDLIIVGPTQTNVNDFRVILVDP